MGAEVMERTGEMVQARGAMKISVDQLVIFYVRKIWVVMG